MGRGGCEEDLLDANPATFGIVRGAVSELHAIAERRDDSRMRDLVATMRSKAIRLRRDVYAALEADGADQARLALRAESLDLATRAATAVITAKAGASMQRGCTAGDDFAKRCSSRCKRRRRRGTRRSR